ncbi:MAG TPA: SCO family protein [Terriglobales bacterium]
MKSSVVARKITATLFSAVLLGGLALAQELSQGGAAGGIAPSAERQDQKPAILTKIGIDQRLNQQLPLDLTFRDEKGKTVRLGDSFGSKPVILSLVYYQCPMLCNQVLDGMTSALSVLKFDAGKEFNIVTVSIDPRETPEMAEKKKEVFIHRYQRPTASQGWSFLTGDQANIDRLAKAIGFHYVYDEKTKQYAHASGIVIATPDGHLAQYYYGIEYSPKDLRLGLIQASQNKIGTAVDQLILYCYHYDPTTGHYGAIAMRIMRLGGVLTLVVLGGFVITMLRRESNAGTLRRGKSS